MKYLKKANLPTISTFLLWNIALFLVFSQDKGNFWQSIHRHVLSLKELNSLFIFLTPITLTVASGFIPASWKAVLVFWRIKNALPGCRAFTYLAVKDARINRSEMRKLLGRVPSSPSQQNAIWYEWYKNVEKKTVVRESHKQFLLNRDLSAIAVLFFCFGTFVIFVMDISFARVGIYALVTLFQYLIFSLIARNHGNRFVCNVVAEYIYLKTGN